jgi:nucleotide-binding universal stress UspA family protein
MDMSIHRMLVPLDFPGSKSSVADQAVYLARQFQAEIILLHVVSPWSHLVHPLEQGTEFQEQGLWVEAVQQAQRNLDHAHQPEPRGVVLRRLLRKGDPAREILRAARDEHADLILMSTRHHGSLYRFLLGSVTAKVLHDADLPVWTDKGRSEELSREFAIRSVLCAIDLSAHSRETLVRAAQVASRFGARLTLAHVTASVETYGPGGAYVIPEWKEALVSAATNEIAKLQRDVGTKADVIIENGHLHTSLNLAAEHSKADILVIGRLGAGGHLGQSGSGYAVIRDSTIPVLSL